MTDVSSLPTSRAELEALIEAAVERKLETAFDELKRTVAGTRASPDQSADCGLEERATIVAFSGDMDRLFATFAIASGAVAMGMEVSIFFTFWGLTALRVRRTLTGKSFGQKLAGLMLPAGPDAVPTSRLNMAGAGPLFFKMLMKQKHMPSVSELLTLCRELGIRIVACETSMGVMGITREELLPDIEYGGVATYLGDASRSKITLFV